MFLLTWYIMKMYCRYSQEIWTFKDKCSWFKMVFENEEKNWIRSLSEESEGKPNNLYSMEKFENLRSSRRFTCTWPKFIKLARVFVNRMKLNKEEHFNSFIFYDKYLSENRVRKFNNFLGLLYWLIFCQYNVLPSTISVQSITISLVKMPSFSKVGLQHWFFFFKNGIPIL